MYIMYYTQYDKVSDQPIISVQGSESGQMVLKMWNGPSYVEAYICQTMWNHIFAKNIEN